MCGRFSLAMEMEALRMALALGLMPEAFYRRFNIAPGQMVATVPDRENRDVVMMKWGLVPFWAKDPGIGYKMINARAETLLEKPSYKTSFRHKRCLILADGFYEWAGCGSKNAQPWYFSLRGGAPFAFAGLWDDWEPKGVSSTPGLPGLTTCTIITTTANRLVSPLHPRMPVILQGEQTRTWLESGSQTELLSLLKPADPARMQAWPVGREVNSPANDDETLIRKLV
ncbi:MAG: SOS response-associated peptidase [Anaerolineaceae bacterium]|nr:SOS response-associated peptidase [Anaerolineaceae bacterium]